MAGRVLGGHRALISCTVAALSVLPGPATQVVKETPRPAAGSLRLQPSADLGEGAFFAESPLPASSALEVDFESALSALAAFL